MRLTSRLREATLALGVLLSTGCIVEVENHCTLEGKEQARAQCRANHQDLGDEINFNINWVCTDSTCPFSPRALDGCYDERVLIAQNIPTDHECVYSWLDANEDSQNTSPALTQGSQSGTGTAGGTAATDTLSGTTDSTATSSGTTSGTGTTSGGSTGDGDDDQDTSGDDQSDSGPDDEGAEEGDCRDDDDCGLGSDGPYCDTVTGACVQCVVDDHCPGPTNGCGDDNACHLYDCLSNEHCSNPDKPICDDELRECVPCTRVAGQCSKQAACIPATGRCFPADQVVHVRKGVLQCGSGSGDNQIDPLCSIELALARIESEGWKQATIVVGSNGGAAFEEEVHISGDDLQVALIGVDESLVQLKGTGKASGHALELSDKAELFISGIRLQGAFEHGLKCTMSDLWVEDSLVQNNGLSGVEARDCDLKVRRTVFMSNSAYGIHASGGSLDLVNTIIASNGDNTSGGGGVVCNTCELSGSYVTIADNRGNDFNRQLHCPAELESGRLRNSILVGSGEESVECPGFSLGESVVDKDGFGGSNRFFDNPNTQQWFIDNNKATPNYRLRNDTSEVERELKAAARRRDGDPPTDIDGTARPSNDKRDYPGAHIPLPE